MEVSGQFHAPTALLLSKEPLVAIEYVAGWAIGPAWMQWQGEIDKNNRMMGKLI
jgi:hypothetical protein